MTTTTNKKDLSYMGNPRLRKAHTQISLTKKQLSEYTKCMYDPIYFTKKYMKIVVLGKGIQPFDLYDFQEDMIATFTDERFVICKIPRQSGKALDLETPILTPQGFVRMGDLKDGDIVYGQDGKETKIEYATETRYNHKCYKVIFDNGDEIVADAEHLWTVNSNNWDIKNKILTTEQLIDYLPKKQKNARPYIDIQKPIETNKPVSYDPYLLGIWLGDGSSRTGDITCHNDDSHHYVSQINREINIKKYPSKPNITVINIRGLTTELKKLNQYKNKHIPTDILFAPYEQKLLFLKGLMDTDGTITEKGSCEFFQKNEDFIDDFRSLLSTMGIKSRKRPKIVNKQIYWTVSFCPDINVFSLPRKAEKQILGTHVKNKRIYIKDIIPTESVPVRCIRVDNNDHMFLAGHTLIPTHNSITTIAFLLHSILFNEHYSIGVLAHKGSAANGLLARLKLAYENLPLWLQQGIVEWNKGTIELENGSTVGAYATSADGLRSKSMDCILLDEFAFVPNNIAEEFFTSTYPVISAGNETKIIIVSTPRGMNHFYEMWVKAEQKKSEFVTIDVHWSAVPGRDQAWKEKTIRNTSEEQFNQEFNCEFLGSSSTLISATKLRQLMLLTKEPITKDFDNMLDIYEMPEEDHTYTICVDVSEGVGQDFSAYSIIDVTEVPYRLVAKYRNKNISPIELPAIVLTSARAYNDAFILVEINSIGHQVADILHFEFGYENLVKVESKGKQGQIYGPGFKRKIAFGLRHNVQTKGIGCTNLKTLIENDKLIIPDSHCVKELTSFVVNKKTYKAEDGSYDDLVMTLVNFGWLTSQRYFKEEILSNIRQIIQEENLKLLDSDLLPAPIIDDGLDHEKYERDANGELWFTDLQEKYPFDPFLTGTWDSWKTRL